MQLKLKVLELYYYKFSKLIYINPTKGKLLKWVWWQQGKGQLCWKKKTEVNQLWSFDQRKRRQTNYGFFIEEKEEENQKLQIS
jgi:hypothetical protein